RGIERCADQQRAARASSLRLPARFRAAHDGVDRGLGDVRRIEPGQADTFRDARRAVLMHRRAWPVLLLVFTSIAQARRTDDLMLPPGFKAELLYRVPRETQGSWVCMAADPRGRLIASDQSGP